MKRTIIIISLLLILNSASFCQEVIIRDAKTNKEFSESDSVKITMELNLTQVSYVTRIYNSQGGTLSSTTEYYPDINRADFITELYDPRRRPALSFMGLVGQDDYHMGSIGQNTSTSWKYIMSWKITAETYGYEPFHGTSSRRYSRIPGELDFQGGRLTIYLKRKEEMINPEGNLKTDQQKNSFDAMGVSPYSLTKN